MTIAYELGKFGIQMAGWGILPRMLTERLLKYIYSWYPKILGRSPPTLGSPEHRKHYKWTYAVVVFGYAVFTFHSAAAAIEKNHYELLGVDPIADNSGLKAAFRTFAKKYHPDRAGPDGETFFMEIRSVFDALKNPTTRFAYDRLGPEALQWKHTDTTSEYLNMWLWQLIPNYLVTIFGVLFWNAMFPHSLVFWNFIIVFGTLALEVLFVLSPSPHAPSSATSLSSMPLSSFIFSSPTHHTYANIFTYLWPRRVAYQHILLIRQLSLLMSSALHHVIPAMFPSSTPAAIEEKMLMEYLRGLMGVTRQMDEEIVKTLHTSIHSAHGQPSNSTPSSVGFSAVRPMEIEPPVTERLLKELQDMVMENVLFGQGGPLRSACEGAVIRRRRTMMERRPTGNGQASSNTVTGVVARTAVATKETRVAGVRADWEKDRERETSGRSERTLVGAFPDDEEESSAPPAPGEILDRYLATGNVNDSPLVLPAATSGTGSRPEYVRARSQSL
ncbi:hypothetical protein BC629DRAFT_1587359 [Irpex lacteus]|nr:hypothetical protein BC629DRAFT_1587359 [Irpex lacteus]